MTIDELLMQLEYNEHVLTREYKAAKSMLEELKWWREQDLIKRDDAIREIMDIADYYNSKGEHFAEYAVSGCGNALGILSKAEPPCVNSNEIKRELNERNGDCETCKHYDEPCCEKCGDGVDYYEPYIPKEDNQ